MRLMLEALGATVRVAEEGTEALELAAGSVPDLILCDLKMPGMDGYTFMRHLHDHERLRGVRVVAVSGLGRPADHGRSRLAGFDGHLVKPIYHKDLVALLERVFWAKRRK